MKKFTIRAYLALALALMGGLSITACSTIEDAADSVKDAVD